MDWENALEKKTMNALGKRFRKKTNPKNQKTVKIRVKLPHVNKIPLANICSNTVFSLHFKFRAKKFHATKPLAFSLHFLFRRDQNHYSNLTPKIMNIAGRLPENSRNRFVDRQSKKTVIKTDQKKSSFH